MWKIFVKCPLSISAINISDTLFYQYLQMSNHSCVIYAFEINKWFIIIKHDLMLD